MRFSTVGLLRLLLLLFLGGFLGYLAWSLAGVRRTPPPAPAGQTGLESAEAEQAPQARVEAMDFTRSKEGRPHLRIQAEAMKTYPDGVTVLEEAVITLPSPDGTGVWTAKGRTAKMYDKPRQILLEGQVEVVSTEGAKLETEALRYDEEQDVLRSEGAVRITRDGILLTAAGLTHWPGRGETLLEGNVRGRQEAGEGAEFGAETVLHRQAGGGVELRGGVHARSGRFRLQAEELDVDLDEEGRTRGGEARGGPRIWTLAPPEQTLSGHKITFRVERGELRSVEAEGDATASIETEGRDPLVVAGDRISIGLDSGGRPSSLTAEAQGEGRVRVTGLPGAAGATARARSVDAVLGEDGTAREARLEGDVTIRRDEIEAMGDHALWRLTGDLVLTGSPGIHTPRGNAYGERIVVGRDGGAVVEGRVHSVMDPSSGSEDPMPLIQEDAGLIYISSDRLEVAADGGRLVYEGSPVQAKQGDSSVLAERLEIEEKEGRVWAEGGVRSRVRLARAPAGEPEERAPSMVVDPYRLMDGRSETLLYRKNTIVYGGGGVLEQAGDRLVGETITIHLAEGKSGQVRLIEAEGQAEAHMGERSAWGDRIDYEAEAQRVIVYGTARPARVEDRSREVSGRGKIVTLNLDSGTLVVEADPHGRTASAFRMGGDHAPGGGDQGEGPD